MTTLATPHPHPITEKNIERIRSLEQQSMLKRSGAEQVAETITRIAGATPFIVLHAVWFAAWIPLNMGIVSGVRPWDPFPFSFLTLVVSLEAIFLSLLVLMAQNRLTQDADKRAQLDLQINMLAEQESTTTLQMLESICQHLGIAYTPQDERELATATDVAELAKSLDERLTSHS